MQIAIEKDRLTGQLGRAHVKASVFDRTGVIPETINATP